MLNNKTKKKKKNPSYQAEKQIQKDQDEIEQE